jgi:hypothetical protein
MSSAMCGAGVLAREVATLRKILSKEMRAGSRLLLILQLNLYDMNLV